MSTIQDLTAAVTSLTAAVATVPVVGNGGTVLSAADQAELDSDVVAINAATAQLTADETVVPPVSASGLGLPGMVTAP